MKQICDTESLYKQYWNKLVSFILARVSHKEVAEDIVQDSFVKLEQCCQSGCECDYPKSYLYKVALNTLSDFYKKQKKQEEVEKLHDTTSNQSDFPHDVYECVYQFLEKLSPQNRQAYILSDIENIPQKEIAERLNLPISTLKSRVQRTRQFLKQEFEQCLKTC